MRSAGAPACSSTTICWPPGARREALCELVEQLGAQVVACAFLVELGFLGGRERLAPHPRALALIDLRLVISRRAVTRSRATRTDRGLPPSEIWELLADPHHHAPVVAGGARGWRASRRTASPRSHMTKKGRPVRIDFTVRRLRAALAAGVGAGDRGNAVRARARRVGDRDRARARRAPGRGSRSSSASSSAATPGPAASCCGGPPADGSRRRSTGSGVMRRQLKLDGRHGCVAAQPVLSTCPGARSVPGSLGLRSISSVTISCLYWLAFAGSGPPV